MDERSPLDADRIVELILAAIAAAFLVAGVSLLLRPGKRLAGAALVAIGGVFALALYVFATFTLRF